MNDLYLEVLPVLERAEQEHHDDDLSAIVTLLRRFIASPDTMQPDVGPMSRETFLHTWRVRRDFSTDELRTQLEKFVAPVLRTEAQTSLLRYALISQNTLAYWAMDASNKELISWMQVQRG